MQPGKPAWQVAPSADDPAQRWTIRRSTARIDLSALRPTSDNDWENETVFAVNKEPGHATFVPFASVAEMQGDPSYRRPWVRNRSSRYMLLNGMWKFHWVKSPDERPADFYRERYDVSAWDEIPVPSNWEIARLRYADLHERDLPAQESAALHPSAEGLYEPDGDQPGGFLPPRFRPAGRLEGP